MIISIDKYLDALLSFVPRNRNSRMGGDYVALIHVPATGPERVYSLVYDDQSPLLTVANYRETVWEMLERSENGEREARPELDALQATLSPDHPVFSFLDAAALSACRNLSDGQPGMDYYLMLWQKDGEANVVEAWEPYGHDDQAWLTVIGAMQVLYSQFQYAAEAR